MFLLLFLVSFAPKMTISFWLRLQIISRWFQPVEWTGNDAFHTKRQKNIKNKTCHRKMIQNLKTNFALWEKNDKQYKNDFIVRWILWPKNCRNTKSRPIITNIIITRLRTYLPLTSQKWTGILFMMRLTLTLTLNIVRKNCRNTEQKTVSSQTQTVSSQTQDSRNIVKPKQQAAILTNKHHKNELVYYLWCV